MRKTEKRQMRQIALERINRLFRFAEENALKHNKEKADRYVHLARKIGMRYNVSIPKMYKRRFCKYCHTYLLPSVNSRVRTKCGRITIFCEECSRYIRIPFTREIKERRK